LIGLDAQIDLLTRLGKAPLDPLVEALRDLHVRGPEAAGKLQQLLSSLHVPAAAPAEEHPIDTVPAARTADYETARRHFVDHGRRLREQALLAERLLEAFVRRQSSASPLSLRDELPLTCVRGGTAAIDFIVVNREPGRMRVRFDLGAARPEVASFDLRACLSFDPPAPCLQPGAEVIVRCVLDLRSCALPAGDFDVDVDVRGDDRLLVKLWLHLHVTEEVTHGQPTA
jgi:hypothetical protein